MNARCARARGAAALAVLAAVAGSCAREPAPPPDTEVVVARVNGTPITLDDLKAEIVSVRGLSPSLPTRAATRSEVFGAMRRLVEQTLVVAEGRRLGVSVSPAEVEEEIRRIRADFPPAGFEKALLAQGIDFAAWRAALARSLLYRKSAAAVAAAQPVVVPEDVERAARRRARAESRPERVRVWQLLFAEEEQARRAREMLAQGVEPAEAARRAGGGDAPGTAVDLGFVAREDLPPGLAEALFALPPGGVSSVVPQDRSFSVFRVAAKEPARTLPAAVAAAAIREELLRARREEAFRRWLAREVARADVRVRRDLLDRLAGGGT